MRITYSCLSLLLLTQCPAQGKGERRDSRWQFVLKLTSSQLRIPSCQIPGMFIVGRFFLNPSALKLRKPCACFRSPLQFQGSHTGLSDGSLLPSKVHFSSIPPFTCLLLQEPQLGPPPPRHSAFDSKKDKWNYHKLVREELPSRFTSPHP